MWASSRMACDLRRKVLLASAALPVSMALADDRAHAHDTRSRYSGATTRTCRQGCKGVACYRCLRGTRLCQITPHAYVHATASACSCACDDDESGRNSFQPEMMQNMSHYVGTLLLRSSMPVDETQGGCCVHCTAPPSQ
jgi:hypothetical protein